MIILAKAKDALEASEKKAKELNIAISTVVVDTHGSVVASSRMDGAIPISPEFAYTKAYTSASLGMPTSGIGEYAIEGKPYFGLASILGGKLTPIPGGLPVKSGSKIIGGVGVGGSTDVSQDALCAQEAVKVLEAGV